MKLTVFFSSLLLITNINAQTIKKVCFIGNSYTYVNDLPKLIDSIANRDGNDLIKDQNTPGGYTLEGHSTNVTSLTKIAADEWDYVVVQDQSQRPSFPYAQVIADVYPYAEILCDSIRSANNCAIPLFYNTWGREVGDDQWDSINSFEKMNNRLFDAYSFMAEENEGKLSPVGIGFRHVFDEASTIVTHGDLYSADGSHPSIIGSYLAACIFYNVIFETNSVDNTYLPAGVTDVQATYLQNIADHVVYEIDSVQTNYMALQAGFNETRVGLTSTFTNTSIGANSYLWDFGDGVTSTDENPSHVFAGNNIYEVTLTVTSADLCEGKTTKNLNFGNAGLNNNEFGIDVLNIYPNPTQGQVTIQLLNQVSKVEVFDVNGKLVNSIQPNSNLVQIELVKGIYFVKAGTTRKKLIVL